MVVVTDQLIQERREAAAAVLRDQIVDTFAEVALRDGYAQASILDIVREARISKTTFYAQFADKEAVYLALQATTRAAKEDAVRAAVAGLADDAALEEVVGAVIGAYLDATLSRPAFLAGMQIEAQVPGQSTRQARADTGLAFATAIVRLAEQRAAPNGLPLTIPLALWGLAGTNTAVISTAADGPETVLSLKEQLTAFWLRLLGHR
jgi:AcrR family transcriptional regulator